ncbi:TetR/AcrR family transcriptional regulator [Streptomyces sp. NPDC046261]|uniref:TetR/AcrR family transcriptional regulator n=1 Tax=Streptomyces sp. NPDC046261 TaxID=3157200 RepID=UPI0033CF8636
MEREPSLRDRLIDVGVDLVMTEGSAALGLREIARRAGVSHGAPRRYFPTHHSLLSAIARRGFADLASRIEAAIRPTSGPTADGARTPREQAHAIGRAYVGYALECRGMFELMFRHDLLDSDKAALRGEQDTTGRPRLRESTLPLFELLVGLVARCRPERGDQRGPDTPAAVTAAALWSNLHGLAQLWAWGSLQLVLPAAPSDDDRLEELDRLVAAVLDAHLGPADA